MTVKTIKSAGGDFTTLSAWEASLAGTLSNPEEAECYNFALSDDVGLAGSATSAANYIRIYTPTAQRHDGRSRAVSGTGFRISSTSGVGTIRNANNHVRLEGLEIEATSSGFALIGTVALSAGADIRVEKCIIHDALTGTSYTCTLTASNMALIFRNNIVYGSQRSIDTRGVASATGENCTFWRHAAELGVISTTEAVWKNTYSGHTGAVQEDFWTGGAAPTGNNNASSDTSQATDYTAGQSSVAGSAVFTSVTPGSEDFTLKAGTNALVANGATLGSVTDDIIGTSRPQGTGYDIGAFERIVAASGKLFIPSFMTGLGSGGPFFHDRIA